MTTPEPAPSKRDESSDVQDRTPSDDSSLNDATPTSEDVQDAVDQEAEDLESGEENPS